MSSKLRLFKMQEAIHRHNLDVTNSHSNTGDLVHAKGKHDWLLEYKDPMNGYGMFREVAFMDLEPDQIWLIQYYEHSRGGHTDPFVHAHSPEGKLLWSRNFRGYAVHEVVRQNDLCWLLNTFPENRKEFSGNPKYTGCHLECIDLKTGEPRSNTPLNFPDANVNSKMGQWIGKFGLYPFRTRIEEKDGEIWLEIFQSNFGKQLQKDFPTSRRRFSDVI